jgi:hypothetical protein
VVGDIDGDDFPEIIAVRNNVVFASPEYTDVNLIAYRVNGTVARSWRLFGANGNQPTQNGPPLIGDFDGDGNVDLAVNCRLISGGGISGYLHEGMLSVLRLSAPYRPGHCDWPMYFHDTRNSSVGFIAAKLNLAQSGSNLLLSWPLQPDAPVIQFGDELTTNSWQTFSPPVLLTNGWNTATLEITNARRWFRLQYP